jgi:acyl carrier protein
MNKIDGFEDALMKFIRSELKPDLERVGISTDLIKEEIVDSLGILAIIGFVEEWFEIEIDSEDVSVDNFRTVLSIRDLAMEKLSL